MRTRIIPGRRKRHRPNVVPFPCPKCGEDTLVLEKKTGKPDETRTALGVKRTRACSLCAIQFSTFEADGEDERVFDVTPYQPNREEQRRTLMLAVVWDMRYIGWVTAATKALAAGIRGQS